MANQKYLNVYKDFAWPANGSDFDLHKAIASLSQIKTEEGKRKGKSPSILKDLDAFEIIIKSGYQQYQQSSELLINLSPAAEWMLDNYVIIEQSIRLIRENLPTTYENQLPRFQESDIQGHLRIMALSLLVLRTASFLIDETQFQEILSEFQSQEALTTGELWALPSMLRFGLIAALAYSLSSSPEIKQNQTMKDQRYPFLEHMVLLPDEIIARVIPGLRQLSAIDWPRFFETCSPLEKIFLADPAQIYAEMDFNSRDQYRRCLEDLAVNSDNSEIEIANRILLHCQENQALYQSSTPNTELEKKILLRKTHIGYYLLDEGYAEVRKAIGYRVSIRKFLILSATRHPTFFYIGAISFFTMLFEAVLFKLTFYESPLYLVGIYLLLALLPLLSIAIGLVNFLINKLIPPHQLPKMDFTKTIPDTAKTVVVIPALIDSQKEISSLLRQLEKHYLSNSDPNLSFVLLSDFSDSPQESIPEDTHFLEQVVSGIQMLNQRYAPVFYLFHRKRLWNPAENVWMGWERKRGKLAEFNQYLLDPADHTFDIIIGDTQHLKTIRYAITLDSDTELPAHTARTLIATIAHPLNQAVFNPDQQKVIKGYAILQPRVQINPAFSASTWFSKIFIEDTYFDLYTQAVSDTYMDLFGEGIFVGKGIYDVKAFTQTMQNRIPENALLSHDLFEGLYCRVGLASDIVIYEEFPRDMIAFLNRQHRWIRGDWQLTPWLLPIVPNCYTGHIINGLSIMGRWKILDNLRRSLLPLSILSFLFFTWLFFPGFNGVSIVLVLITYFLPALLQILNQGFGFLLKKESVNTFFRSALAATFLVTESAVNFDAISSVLHRVYISRKRLLEWVTAAHTIRLSRKNRKKDLIWRRMIKANYLLLIGFLVLVFCQYQSIWAAVPWMILWGFAPAIAGRISKPIIKKTEELPPYANQIFRNIALRTWMFFETYVGPDDSWLPPDHFQESPKGVVAHRTSPTNIGLYLLSLISGYEFGYITTIDLIYRVQRSMETIAKMGNYRGHLYNWYDTQNLQPLLPRYISTVDSGNLAACYLSLAHYINNLKNSPMLQWCQFEALIDCFSILKEIFDDIPIEDEKQALQFNILKISQEVVSWQNEPKHWIVNLQLFMENSFTNLADTILNWVEKNVSLIDSETIHAIHVWVGRTQYQADNILDDFHYMAPWIADTHTLIQEIETANHQESGARHFLDILKESLEWPTSLSYLETIELLIQKQRYVKSNLFFQASFPLRMMLENWSDNLDISIEAARKLAHLQRHNLNSLCSTLIHCYRAMDFSFLFHKDRKVFHIGYNLETGQLDNNYYDLLASESRIASFIAIAKGDVPQSHWKHLARPITRINNRWVLLSWSATMFEYLMPTAIMKTPSSSLLGISVQNAIAHQISYANHLNLPWGMSESGYYQFDSQLNYQYRAFGTPGLGLKRGLGNDLVVAPYASLMCVNQVPDKVLQNLKTLNQLNARGIYGYYEAIDFTPKRSPEKEGRIVKSYMAHHQGMILAALCNFLKSDRLIKSFHEDAQINAQIILLYETMGRDMPADFPHSTESSLQTPPRKRITFDPWHPLPNSDPPILHLLSNGKFHVAISSDGAGFSRFEDREISRWRNDSALNQYGAWFYLFDHDTKHLWSISEMPIPEKANFQEISFYPHKVEFTKSAHGIAAHMDIIVPMDDNLEIRRLRITNQSDRSRKMTISSYSEIMLSSQHDDQRHPAFNKMFIESDLNHELQSIMFSRRLRSGIEKPFHYAHGLFCETEFEKDVAYCLDRGSFIGRSRDIQSPVFFKTLLSPEKSQSSGYSLDPIASINVTFHIPAHETITVYYLSVAGNNKNSILKSLKKYRNSAFIDRCFETENIKVEHNLTQMNIEPEDIELHDKLFSLIMYPSDKMRATSEIIQRNTLGQSGLWPFGISGDFPICLIKINKLEQINYLSRILRGYIYWRSRNIKIDLILLNERDSTYDEDLNNLLQRLITKLGASPWMSVKGGIYLLRADQLPIESYTLLETSAQVILSPTSEEIDDLLLTKFKPAEYLPQFHAALPPEPVSLGKEKLVSEEVLQYRNQFGGFSETGHEYHIRIDSEHVPPAPWINVISNPNFGFVISESGIGWSWAVNSGENRLTHWRNDPVQDQPGEAVYLRDEETGQVWSPTFLPSGSTQPYDVIHGIGYSIFRHCSHGILSEMTVFIDTKDPVKFIRLRIKNVRNRISRISSLYYAEWVLGSIKNQSQTFIQQSFDTHLHAIMAQNVFNHDFSRRIAFLAATREPQAVTTNRAEFIGRNQTYRSPAVLQRVALSGTISSAHDPCAAMSHILWLSPGEEKEITYLLGQGNDEEDAKRLIFTYQKVNEVEAALKRSHQFWNETTTAIEVQTPEPSFNILINHWLLYQSISSRFFGRTGFYQSSGAYGFRDQLQDSMAYVFSHPEWTRAFILEAAKHQFIEGDVLHWWHPPGNRGVRTRCSDDMVWLPYVVSEYIQRTGDESILEERVPFLDAHALKENEHERYDLFPQENVQYSIMEHCIRAIHRSTTEGLHGLPLIGSHDWNDGFSRIGIQGQGESIWLGWFLAVVAERFAAFCSKQHKPILAKELSQIRETYIHNILTQGWDGKWFRRAYFDDGSPLGSATNLECQIDAIAQSWAVFAGLRDHPKVQSAMEAVKEHLIRDEDQLILLFTPPLDKSMLDPGYIKGYRPGVRENGGQYTHAAMWTIWAYADAGQSELAYKLFQLSNPIHHSDSEEKALRYAVEPYVVAADIYSSPDMLGRGGWTWYTGSASWMYRLGVERLLGLQLEKDGFTLNPAIPAAWEEYQLRLRLPKGRYDITIRNPMQVNGGIAAVSMNGQNVRNQIIPWMEDGEIHTVVIRMGSARET
jgi:cyclic beta-1,2-glucan synthetase